MDGLDVRAVAWLPSPPLLIPEIGGCGAGDDAVTGLRKAVAAAVGVVTDAGPRTVVVLGPTDRPCRMAPPVARSWHGFGVGERPTAGGPPLLPWQLAVGDWLLDHAGWEGERRYLGVPVTAAGAPPELAADGPVGLLVLGDGSVCRGQDSPGGDDPRAAGWDARLAGVLAGGDLAGLRALDAEQGGQLGSTAAASFPVAAALLSEGGGAAPARAEVTYDAAPYGVGYLVATWSW